MATPMSQLSPNEEQRPSDGVLLAGFLIFNALFRFSLLTLNKGEYTDGILQILQFQQRDSFWPPLYTAFIRLLQASGVEPIMAGRFISWAASVLLILPLWFVTRAWAGRRAALFATALYTASAMALRWSLRVMTDMPFAFLFTLACAGLLGFWARDARGKERAAAEGAIHNGPSADAPLPRCSAARLVWVTLVAVLATLTRYQGLMLAPLVLVALVEAWRRRAAGRLAATLAQVLWLALPAWFLFQRFGHLGQVVERAPEGFSWSTLLNYWYYFEMFIFLTPYFLTLPVFVFFILGLFQGPSPDEGEAVRRMPVRLLLLYSALAILAAQSVFQSFQSRYLLPLLPLALTCAGAGMARMERALSRKGPGGRRVVLVLAGVTLVWSMGFALAVVFLQRGAFGDLYEAGRYIRGLNLPPATRIYSNETYKPRINCVKLAFAAGRRVDLVPEIPLLTEQQGPPGGAGERMPPGSLVVLHSAYSGGLEGQSHFVRLLREDFGYDLKLMDKAVFTSSLVPLLPDIMEEPLTHQNPLAWLLRYRRQEFRTEVYVVNK